MVAAKTSDVRKIEGGVTEVGVCSTIQSDLTGVYLWVGREEAREGGGGGGREGGRGEGGWEVRGSEGGREGGGGREEGEGVRVVRGREGEKEGAVNKLALPTCVC